MDRTFLKRFHMIEQEVLRMKVLERLAPETMGVASAFGSTGVRGIWPMSVYDSNGDAYDISGHGHHLSYNGNPKYGYASRSGPYIALDGIGGDYLSRLDEADLDITGLETYISTGFLGLTYVSWVYFDNAVGSIEGIMSKWATGTNDRSYQVYRDATGDLNFEVSLDGTAITNVQLSAGLDTQTTWYFIACRYDPSTSMKVWVNTLTNTNTTSIPVSIYAGIANLYLGSLNTANDMTGRIGISALYAAYLSDTMVATIFEMTRGMYGV